MTRALTQEQRDWAAEIVSIRTGMNCFEDAVMVIEQVKALIEAGEPNINIVRWLNLMPRARAAALAAQHHTDESLMPSVSLVSPMLVEGRIPTPTKRRVPDRYSKPGPRAAREAIRRDPTGTCVDCGSVFEMNPHGRPAKKCPEHRRAA